MLRISIIMPSFNQAEYLGRAIESVQRQRGDFELEHIVMDGGSTDGSVDILRRCGDRLQWVSEPDEGQSDALNKGIARATGDVIGWLNSDDLLEPGALAAVAEVFEAEPDTQWLYGKVRVIDESDREIRKAITWYKNWRMRRYSFQRLLAENYICQMGVFWRAEAGRAAGPFRTDLHLDMDYEYWLRLGALYPGRFVDRYLGCFRYHGASKSGTQIIPTLRAELDIARDFARGRYPWAILWHHVLYARTAVVYTFLHVAGRVRQAWGL
jgi:glycosyltransferase involved in cell wall biosynthesis